MPTNLVTLLDHSNTCENSAVNVNRIQINSETKCYLAANTFIRG